MRHQDECFGCGGRESSTVFEFNGLVLLDSLRESPLARYDYAVCHQCGMVYATCRPEGNELEFLYSRFNEFLGRTTESGEGQSELVDPELLDKQMRHGWLVSEHTDVSEDKWLPDVLNFRVAEAYHTDILASLVPLSGARVLELRSLDGHMLRTFRERYGAAEVIAMPMSERNQTIIETLHGIPTAVIDFDEMNLPAGPFDLIVARHMLTHALHPRRFWDAITGALAPHGWLYLYLENDDEVMFGRRKNLFGEMKCFHFQNFDMSCLLRVLRARGFEPGFIRHPRAGKSEMICLARRIAGAACLTPLSPEAVQTRRRLYEHWRALSVLSAPEPIRRLFKDQLDSFRTLAIEAGYGVKNKDGAIVPVKLRVMHEEGYSALNQRNVVPADAPS